jgi:hypothetical protein
MVAETKNGAKRTSHPIIARKIWEAIGSLQSHKKITDIDNIVTELEDKNQINATETLYQIQKCVTDRILISNKIENENDEGYTFSIPPEQPNSQIEKERDWYCFECHQADMVYSCRTCFRSYHVDCSNQLRDNFKMERESEEDLKMTKWQCPWCVYGRERPISEDRTNLDRLHHCFNLIIEEIEREFGSDLQEKLNAKIYFKNFVFRDTDIEKIKKLVQRNQIKFIDQMELEMRNLLHNYHCYYGGTEFKTQRLDQATQHIQKMLSEMNACIECFLNKHQQKDEGINWFLEACKPPHVLCFAKTKTNGMMPAKIIKTENSRYEVMFFGNKHEKVWLDRTQIQNLDLSSIKEKKSLVIKTAVAEVSEHIKNVKKRFGNEILKKLKFESDGTDIDDISPTRDEPDDQDDSSNSSTEKQKGRKRPLRNRDSNIETKISKNQNDSKLFGVSLTDLSERRDESCQTDPNLQPVGLDDKQKKQIEKEAREAAKLEFNKILDEERKQHQIEVKKLKKKQWCAMCLKEARYFCCTTFFYCSVECQRNHWSHGGHNEVCKKRPGNRNRPNGQNNNGPNARTNGPNNNGPNARNPNPNSRNPSPASVRNNVTPRPNDGARRR